MSSRRRLGARYITRRRRIISIGGLAVLVGLAAWAVWAVVNLEGGLDLDALQVGLLPAAEVALFGAGALMLGTSLAPVWIRLAGGVPAWKPMVWVGTGLALLGAGLVAINVSSEGGPWAFDSRLVQVAVVAVAAGLLASIGTGRPFLVWLAGLVVAVASAALAGELGTELLARAGGRVVAAAWVGSLVTAVPAFTSAVFTDEPPGVARAVDRVVLIHGWSLLLFAVAAVVEAYSRTPELATLVNSRLAQLRGAQVVIGALIAAWGVWRRRPEMGALIEAAVAVMERDRPRRRLRSEDELVVPVDNLVGVGASRMPHIRRVVLAEATAVAVLTVVMLLAA